MRNPPKVLNLSVQNLATIWIWKRVLSQLKITKSHVKPRKQLKTFRSIWIIWQEFPTLRILPKNHWNSLSMRWRSANKQKLKTNLNSARREENKLFQMSNRMIFSTKRNRQLMLFPNRRSRKSKSKSLKRTWFSPLKWVTSKTKIPLRPNPQKPKSKHKSSPPKTPKARKSHLSKVKSTNRRSQASLTWKRNAVANNKCSRPLAPSPTSSTTTTSTTS